MGRASACIVAAALASAALTGAAARAAVISYTYNATVTNVVGGGPYGMTAAVGQAVQGSFGYDSNAPDQSPSPLFGHYTGDPVGAYAMNFASGDYVIDSFFDVFITLDITTPFDEMEIYTSTNVYVNGVMQPGAEMYMQFRDNTATIFPTDALPPETLTINDFNLSWGYIRDVVSGQRIDFAVSYLHGIPAPASLCAVGAGLVLVGRRRR